LRQTIQRQPIRSADEPPRTRLSLDIPWRTIFRIFSALVLVWLWLHLWQWILLFVIAVFLALGLDPLVTWLDEHRVRRGFAAPLVVLALAAILCTFGYLAGGQLIEQAQLLGGRVTDLQRKLADLLPSWAVQMLPKSGGLQLGDYATRFGRSLVSGLMSIGIALILTVYLLLDGRRTFEWLVAFTPHEHRARVKRTAVEGRKAIVAYVCGNALTSLIAAVCAYIFLVAFKVPAALLLALLTGIFDFVPVIGVFLTAIPMVLLALSVSMTAAVATAIFNTVYNIVETYYISPKVYGNELRLSSLAVILGFAAGAELGGVVGALISLPIVALYPTIENIWLRDRLPPEVLEDHRQIEQTEEH
jgi:predicted PurR-regulated permease PerM